MLAGGMMSVLSPVVLVATRNEPLARLCRSALGQGNFRCAVEVAAGWRAAAVQATYGPLNLVLLEGELFPAPTYRSITHGDLNGGNIFVDKGGRPWLIDFFKSGWGPVLRDLAELEGESG
jgi:hypothetical protein